MRNFSRDITNTFFKIAISNIILNLKRFKKIYTQQFIKVKLSKSQLLKSERSINMLVNAVNFTENQMKP